jgi:DNA polymerase elongation subunit (family B)
VQHEDGPFVFMPWALRIQDGVLDATITCPTGPDGLAWYEDDAVYEALQNNALKPPWERLESGRVKPPPPPPPPSSGAMPEGPAAAAPKSSISFELQAGEGSGVTAVLLGTDARGFTISAFVRGWQPYFDLVIPDGWDDSCFEEFCRELPYTARPVRKANIPLPQSYGFVPDDKDPTRPKKWPCWTLYFSSLSARTECQQWLEACPGCREKRAVRSCRACDKDGAATEAEPPAKAHIHRGTLALNSRPLVSLRLFNTMQTPESLFACDAKITMCGWVRLKPSSIRYGLCRKRRRTYDDVELDAAFEDLGPYLRNGKPLEDIAPQTHFLYDLENEAKCKGFLNGARAFPSLALGDFTTYCGVSLACLRDDIESCSNPTGTSAAVTSVLIVRAPATNAHNTAAALRKLGPFAIADWMEAERRKKQPQGGVGAVTAAASPPVSRVFVHWVESCAEMTHARRDLLVWAQASIVEGWNNFMHDEAFLHDEYGQEWLPPSMRGGESMQAALQAKVDSFVHSSHSQHSHSYSQHSQQDGGVAEADADAYLTSADLLVRSKARPGAWRAWEALYSSRRDIGPVALNTTEHAAKALERKARAAACAAACAASAASAAVPAVNASTPSTTSSAALSSALGRLSFLSLLQVASATQEEAAAPATATATATATQADDPLHQEKEDDERSVSSGLDDSDDSDAQDADAASQRTSRRDGGLDASLRVDDVLEFRAVRLRGTLRAFLKTGRMSSAKDDNVLELQRTWPDQLRTLSETTQAAFWEWVRTTFSSATEDLLRAPQRTQPQRAFFLSRMLGDRTPLLEKKMESQALGSQFLQYIDTFGRTARDGMYDIKNSYKLSSYALKAVASAYLPKNDPDNAKIDLEPTRMFELYERGDFDALAEIGVYCVRDTVLPLKIARAKKRIESLICLSRVSSAQPSVCQNGGQQIKVFSALSRFVHREYGFAKGCVDDYVQRETPSPVRVAEPAAASPFSAAAASVASAAASVASATAEAPQSPSAGGARLATRLFARSAPAVAPQAVAAPRKRSGKHLRGGGAVAPVASFGSKAAKRKAQYKGAIVLDPVPGFFEEPVATLDFNSLYPSIMMAHDLCPSALTTYEHAMRIRAHPNGLVSEHRIAQIAADGSTYYTKCWIVQTIQSVTARLQAFFVAERTAVKGLMAAAEAAGDVQLTEIYNQLQGALKVLCNSTYGFYGCDARKGILSCMILAGATTAVGREMILATKAHAERAIDGLRVIYGDTDSIMTLFPKGTSVNESHDQSVDLAKDITRQMQTAGVGFEHIGGAPHWRKVVNERVEALALAAADAAEEDARYTAVERAAASDTAPDMQSLDAEIAAARAAAFDAAATCARGSFRDFSAACAVLKIVSEKVFWPFLSTETKKCYAGPKYEDKVLKKIEIKGQAAVRRDTPAFVAKCGKDVYEALFTPRADGRFRENIALVKAVVQRALTAVVEDTLPLQAYVKSASIGTDYIEDPVQVRLANRMRARGDADVPSAGQRIDFVITELDARKAARMTASERSKIADRAEHPAFFEAYNARQADPQQRLRIDRAYYVNALMPSMQKILSALDKPWCDAVFAAALARAEMPRGCRVRSLFAPAPAPAPACLASDTRTVASDTHTAAAAAEAVARHTGPADGTLPLAPPVPPAATERLGFQALLLRRRS